MNRDCGLMPCEMEYVSEHGRGPRQHSGVVRTRRNWCGMDRRVTAKDSEAVGTVTKKTGEALYLFNEAQTVPILRTARQWKEERRREVIVSRPEAVQILEQPNGYLLHLYAVEQTRPCFTE